MQPQPVSDVGPVPPVTAVQLRLYHTGYTKSVTATNCVVVGVYLIISLTNRLEILSVGEPQA